MSIIFSLFLYCLFFSLNLIKSQQSSDIIIDTTINTMINIGYQYLFSGDKYMVIQNTYSGKLGNLSYGIVVTNEITFKNLEYKLFDYKMNEPEIKHSNDYKKCPPLIPISSNTKYIIIKIPIQADNLRITSNLKFSTSLIFTAPIKTISSSDDMPINIDYSKSFDYYYIITSLKNYYLTYFSISSNFSISKISCLKIKTQYNDEEILDISYDSFSNEDFKLENNYYNYQGKIDNTDILNQYNYIILRLKMKAKKDEKISLYLAKTEYQEYEVPRSSFLFIIIIVVVIVLFCILCFLFIKGKIFKDKPKEN